MPVEEAQARLLDLLANNGNCRLPCLWGIKPGKSSFYEAQSVLNPLSRLSDLVFLEPPGPGNISPRYTEGEMQIYSNVGFLTDAESGTVSNIGLNVEAHGLLPDGYENVYDSRLFGERISAYALSHVLSELGMPASVTINTLAEPWPLSSGGAWEFGILLLYPDQGVLVNYTTQSHSAGTNVRACPENAHVEMELFPAGDPARFFAGLERTDWSVKKNWYRPLNDVTDLSIKEFYETFREQTDQCIETPANLWPVPER